MTEEIKEILDDLGNKDNYIEEFGYQYKRIPLFDSFRLLDYITNLQQENETLKAKLEIGKTCGFCPYYDYKSRCEKINEWIHKHQQTMENMRKEKFYTLNLGVDDLKELNNILNGSDENE